MRTFKIVGGINRNFGINRAVNAFKAKKLFMKAMVAYRDGLEDDAVQFSNKGIARFAVASEKLKVENELLKSFFGVDAMKFLVIKESALWSKLNKLSRNEGHNDLKINTINKILHCKQVISRKFENMVSALDEKFELEKGDMSLATRERIEKNRVKRRRKQQFVDGKDLSEIVELENRLNELKRMK